MKAIITIVIVLTIAFALLIISKLIFDALNWVLSLRTPTPKTGTETVQIKYIEQYIAQYFDDDEGVCLAPSLKETLGEECTLEEWLEAIYGTVDFSQLRGIRNEVDFWCECLALQMEDKYKEQYPNLEE